jgi:GMP synthase (glutamine-hydrolysing)
MQTMVHQLGGKINSSHKREFGHAIVNVTKENKLFSNIKEMAGAHHQPQMEVWMSHGDKVVEIPPEFEVIGASNNAPIAAIQHTYQPWYGVQFHPEVTHTKSGKEILSNFVLNICHCEALWTANQIIEDAIATIKQKVGSDEVILGLSGGVDSSVVAALLDRAIGKQLICVFVDTGLLRLEEGDQVMKIFADNMHIKVIRVNAETRYLDALQGVSDPEKKRKIIGNLFVEIFEEEAAKLTSAKWLAQGTIYPDVIESAGAGTGKAHVIKSHHNVGGLPEDMTLKLVEPLRELFKDEVRKIGLELGLPYRMVYRHPFPGPGLGVRILGKVKKEYADILRKADAIFMEELDKSGYYDKVSQAFAVFLPVKSVGVMGDQRKYDYVIALRAVETIDFMTARWAHLPYELLGTLSNRIVNEVAGISRVTYDITGKPPGTIEWE